MDDGICAKCSTGIKKNVQKIECETCKETFHGGCINMKKEDVEYLKSAGTPFTCEKCANEKRKGRGMNSQVKPKTEDEKK